MPKPSSTSVTLDVDVAAEPRLARQRTDTPFRILVLGDFSGRANRGEPPPGRLRPYLIDRDNFDGVLGRIHPELELGPRGGGLLLRFSELGDFHPDEIYSRESFERFRVAAESMAPMPAAPEPPPVTNLLDAGNLLDNVLEATEAAPSRGLDPLQAFIERAAAPYKVPREDPRLGEKKARAAEAAAKLMRAVLHTADFQALEAAWRALDWLVRALETGPQLKIYIADIAKADLHDSLRELRRLLVDTAAATPGAERWTLAVGNYTFARTEADIATLAELARIMRDAGAAFVAEADPREPGSEGVARDWQTLRKSPAASSIGLALPRFLLRLPYGKKTSPIESFPFEEMPGTPAHGEYLWGNPAFACARVLGQAFSGDGWGSYAEITGLPLHVYESEGEQHAKPCAEVLMTEREAEWVLDQGFMPLVSIKNQDAARLLRLQSVADPAAPLSGAWT